jgi:SAM-dependent methyltransferase
MEMTTASRLGLTDIGLEQTGTTAHYRYDTRTTPPDVFEDLTATDWSRLSWKDLGRPYLVDNYSSERRMWEAEHGGDMPVEVQWEHFNRRFHSLFMKDPDEATSRARQDLMEHLAEADLHGAMEVVRDLMQTKIWNYVHRVQDAVWDPRGKRALFEGLDVEKPSILFLGAADGYEAMQLSAMYPGGHAVLVDYDDFCRTERFGNFPEAYPFLGDNPVTGSHKVYRREDFDIDFVVSDIRDLDYGKEFDIVISVGLIEHFPDEYKPLVFDFHRRFLKPGGYAIMTTPRRQLRSKLFYVAMGNLMNYGYRELMDARQLGLYAYENGFDVLRAGYIKAHNGLVTQVR